MQSTMMDNSIMLQVARRNATVRGHDVTIETKFFTLQDRYLVMPVEYTVGEWYLLVVADLAILDLEKRPTEVYGYKYAIGDTIYQDKNRLKEFPFNSAIRQDVKVEDLRLGTLYGSPIARTRWRLVSFEEQGRISVLHEVYDWGEISSHPLKTRTKAFVRWINGDPDHAAVGD